MTRQAPRTQDAYRKTRTILGVRNPQIAMHLIRKITAVLIIDRGAVPCTLPPPRPARGRARRVRLERITIRK